MRRVLITGGAGFLGTALRQGAPPEWELHATRRTPNSAGSGWHTVDLADAGAVRAVWDRVAPDVVVHTAYSMRAPERDILLATRSVADATHAVGAALVHLSTDMVFDGERAPYSEDAQPCPIVEYGRWKAEAEDYVLDSCDRAAVIRTSLITSFTPLDPRSAWVATGLRGEARVTLFTDEIRCPILAADLSAQIWEIIELEAAKRGGVWHLAGPEGISRYALGLLIAAHLRLPADRLVPASSRSSETPRPRDLRLLTRRADSLLRTRGRPISVAAVEGRPTQSTGGQPR